MGGKPEDVYLDGVWRRLGVRAAGDAVAFDDSAPLAAVRRSIAPPP
jgi:hypothetical protein